MILCLNYIQIYAINNKQYGPAYDIYKCKTWKFNKILANLSCIALDALSWSLRTSKCTWRAYLVKYNASSVAVSPPPTTARTCPLNSGDAPSQIAHALIPRLQNSSSRGKLSLLAVAPVA